jgi:ribosome-associated protein
MAMQQRQAGVRPAEFDSLGAARELAEIMADKKASDVMLLEVGKATTLADYFILATGNSDRQVDAIRQAVEDHMEESDVRLLSREGVSPEGWVLLDYGQIVVHVFDEEQRDYYDLERHWKEAPTLLRIQ